VVNDRAITSVEKDRYRNVHGDLDMNRQKFFGALVLSIQLLTGSVPGQARAMILGDFDHDGDVDSVDFDHFRACALGAGIPQTAPACADARLDADSDVDLDDFGAFQRCYSGAGHPANPNCGCPSGQTDCNGICINTMTDNANCGACGNTCAAGLTCQNGTCLGTCSGPCFGGQLCCDGVCREVGLDPSNCGSCGYQCGPGQNCAGGVCQHAEPPGG
jgi:Stigma-specific protein, Stig1